MKNSIPKRLALERRGLKVNIKKLKIMVSGCDIRMMTDSGRWPCLVHRKGAGGESYLPWTACSGCMGS